MSSFYGEKPIMERLKASMGQTKLQIAYVNAPEHDGTVTLVDSHQVIDDIRAEPTKLAEVSRWVGQEILAGLGSAMSQKPDLMFKLRRRQLTGKNLAVVFTGRKYGENKTEIFFFRIVERKKKF